MAMAIATVDVDATLVPCDNQILFSFFFNIYIYSSIYTFLSLYFSIKHSKSLSYFLTNISIS